MSGTLLELGTLPKRERSLTHIVRRITYMSLNSYILKGASISNMGLTKVIWTNRHGQKRKHSLYRCTYFYAVNWFRENIVECQGYLTREEKHASKLELLYVLNFAPIDEREKYKESVILDSEETSDIVGI